MAIYSCNLASIGRSTHAAGTAGAHLSYIGRDSAEPVIMADHMPTDPTQARTWMDRQERGDRANARLGDKIRIALPRELSAEQRAELVRDFAQELTGGRVPWYAGIHQSGEDAHNPHAHIFIRDRDIETGKRVLKLSDSARDREKAGLEPKAVEWVRQRWEACCNLALERAGIEARIDRRSLEAQGIDREPTIHIGPRAQHIETNVARPESKVRIDGRGRQIDYPMIDAGRTRLERNAEIIDFNLERDARSPDFETRERAKWERDQRRADQVLERRLVAEARQRNMERRRVRGAARRELDAVSRQQRDERTAMMNRLKEAKAPALATMRQRHRAEREALAKKESGILRRLMVAIDFTGTTKRNRDASRAVLQGAQKRERTQAAQSYRQDRKTHLEAIAGRYAPIRQEIIEARDRKLAALKERHRPAEIEADRRRQEREAERERGRTGLMERIQTAKRMAGEQDRTEGGSQLRAEHRAASRGETGRGSSGRGKEGRGESGRGRDRGRDGPGLG